MNLYEFVCSSVLVVFNNFLLIDATDRSKIISDQERFFIALSLYPLSFFANTPFKEMCTEAEFKEFEPRFKFKPRLKFWWFYLNLHCFFIQDLNRSSIENRFWGDLRRGLNSLIRTLYTFYAALNHSQAGIVQSFKNHKSDFQTS